MSVRGEFQRISGDFARFLRATRHPACLTRAASLETNSERAGADLSAAARDSLAHCEAAPPGDLGALHRDEYAERADHLAAICRAIVG